MRVEGTHLEQGQEEQGESLIGWSVDQTFGQEQEEPPETQIMAEQSFDCGVEVVGDTAPEDQAKQSIGENAVLVQGLGPRQSLRSYVRRSGQNASARAKSLPD